MRMPLTGKFASNAEIFISDKFDLKRSAYGYDVNSPEFKKWQAEQQQQYAQYVLFAVLL